MVDEPDREMTASPEGDSSQQRRGSGSLAETVGNFERALIEDTLRSTRGNRTRAARLLKTTERILNYRIRRYGIDCDRFRG
jgi:Nif-specific regulatory protein